MPRHGRLLWAALLAAVRLQAQSPATPVPLARADAVRDAIARAATLGLARADTATAFAELLVARAWQNPTVSAAYSKATPQYHVSAELPIDYPSLRSARIRSASLGRDAAHLRFLSARAAVALAADTLYTRALASRERLRLSRANAAAADTLRSVAARRRDAGDASDLDVELAAVNAAQTTNVALGDSLDYLTDVLELQAAIGFTTLGAVVTLTDSLVMPPADSVPNATLVTLDVAAAQTALDAAQAATRAERRGRFATPSLTAGFETGDPSGGEPGVLPTVGIALPLPLLNRNRGPIALVEASRARAEAALAVARIESRTDIERTRRALSVALDRAQRDQAVVVSAARVATMSRTAYREGAYTLAAVLEAQRTSRDALAQYVSDLADAWIASATLHALTLPAPR